MEGINRLASTISISDSLNASIVREVNRYVYISEKAQDIARVRVELNYTCEKLLGKCFDNFKIVLNIEGGEETSINIDIGEFEYEGKISGRIEGRDVYVDIGTGRGGGKITITYVIKARPVKIGRHSVSMGIYYISKKGIRERIGDIIEVVFDAIKPITIDQLLIEPEADVYVVGDNLKLVLKISSEYEGSMNLLCKGAVKELAIDFDIKRGSNILEVDSVITNPSGNVEVLLSIPVIGFKEVVCKELVVEKERFRVNDIMLGEPKMGNEFSLYIDLENLSRIKETPLVIEGKIYGFSIRGEVVLKPRERKLLELKTPILTKDSITNLDGVLSILDTISSQLTSQRIVLPKPVELPVRIELANDTVQIYSDKVYELQLFITNESGKDIAVFPMKISSSLCTIDSASRAEVHSYTSSQLSIPLKPLSLGDEVATIDIAVEVNGSIVDVYQISFNLKVYRSFNIKRDEIKLLNPSKTVYTVKGQRIEIELVVEVLSDYIDLTVDSDDIQIDKKSYRLYNPGGVIVVSGRVSHYKDGVSISVSDGLVKEVIDMPLKVGKPLIEYKFIIPRFFVGLRRSIDIELVNKFEAPLAVSIEFIKFNGIELSDKSRHIELALEPLGKHRVSIEFICLSSGKAKAVFNIYSKYIDVETGNIIDTWSNEDFFEIPVENPIEVDIKWHSDRVLLPYPVIDKVKDVKVNYKLDALIKNVSDTDIYSIEIRADTPTTIESKISPPKIELIKIDEEVPINIVTEIPIGTTLNELELSISIGIDRFRIVSKSVKVGIERYPYTILEIPRSVFNEAQCSYPAYSRGDTILVMFPLLGKDIDVCGEPTATSKTRHEALQLIYEKLTKALSSYESPWEVTASIILRKTVSTSDNYSEYYSYLKKIASSKEGILVVPSYLWYITILKLLGISGGISTGLSRSRSIGLIYTESPAIYRSTDTFYGYLIRFVEGGDKEAEENLYNYILSSVQNKKIDPLFLLYTLNGGKRIPFNNNIADSLFIEKKYYEYLIYLVLTDKNIAEDRLFLQNIKIIVGETLNKRSSITALALLFNRIMGENIELLRRG